MDFTGDGINDILSGCYWSHDENKPDGNPQAGYLMILTGTDEGDFEGAIPLINAAGDPLLNVPLAKDQEENYDINNIEMSNICTAQHAVDYDGDGDLDLVTGCMENSFFVFINSTDDPSEPPMFDSPAERLPIQSPDMHSDPHLHDWDDDGDLDLLTGGDSGSVYLSINIGKRQKPEWSEFKRLIPGSTKYQQSTDDGNEIEPGRASRVWVTDYNRDGRPDLLVGDSITVVNKAKGLTQAEFDRLKAAHESKAQPLMAKMSAIQQKYFQRLKKPSQDIDLEKAQQMADQLIEKMQEEMEPFSSQYSELH
ncbi:FG-GAP-like repeat-containing protein, partial [Mariniblastus sp.]|nr:FG-GAP-like repeat-containing protein [Mariniblastus sp.]